MALVLVTGASTGLGLATARSLVADHHDVVLHARAEGRIEDAGLAGRARAVVEADLSDGDAVLAMSQELDRLGPFDVVVHNAGVLTGPAVGAVNLVAPYLLAATTARPQRLVVLSSSMHLSGDADRATASLEDLRRAEWSYQDSKLAVTALALARRWPQVACHAVDPGWVPTRMGGAHASDDLDEGHRTQVWLATAPADEIDPATGGYWYHHEPRTPHAAVRDEAFQDAVLAGLARATGVELDS